VLAARRLAALAIAAAALPWGALAPASGGATAVVGAVAFEDGTPAAGARLVLLPAGYNATADSAGVFRLEAPAGAYTIRASAANRTVEAPVVLEDGKATPITLTIDRGGHADGSGNLFAFLYLGIAMVAVAVGGFYVNKRMAERGIDLNKSVLGGVELRKPFRRRRKKPKAP
jgi:carboxypeptidase family protein